MVAQEAALAQTQSLLPPLKKQLAQTRDLLVALVGVFTDKELDRVRRTRKIVRIGRERSPSHISSRNRRRVIGKVREIRAMIDDERRGRGSGSLRNGAVALRTSGVIVANPGKPGIELGIAHRSRIG